MHICLRECTLVTGREGGVFLGGDPSEFGSPTPKPPSEFGAPPPKPRSEFGATPLNPGQNLEHPPTKKTPPPSLPVTSVRSP